MSNIYEEVARAIVKDEHFPRSVESVLKQYFGPYLEGGVILSDNENIGSDEYDDARLLLGELKDRLK